MKRILLAIGLLIGSIGGASAACVAPVVMHDFPGTIFNMSVLTAPDGNCASATAVQTWAGQTLGAPSAYGTSPGAVLVPGVNSFITNTPAVSQSGTWNITNLSGTVSLPTGASTSALQTTGNTSLSSIDTKTPALGQALAAASVPVILPAATITTLTPPTSVGISGTLPAFASTPTFNCGTGCSSTGGTFNNNADAVATSATNGQSAAWLYGFNGTTWDRVRADTTNGIWANIKTSVLPAGAATSALQTTGNTSLSSIDTKTPALGQALAAASVPVILPAATITTLTPPAAITGYALDTTLTGGTQRTKVTDGTNNAAVKAASTAAVATDPAMVVAVSPNNTIPISAASLPLPTGASTAAGLTTINTTLGSPMQQTGGSIAPSTLAAWGLVASTQNGATPTNAQLAMGQFNTTPTTITSGNVSPLQMDNAGNLLVNIKAGASSGAVAQGSTTSGQTGGLTQAAVTTAAPTYTTAQTSPLSLTTAGELRTFDSQLLAAANGATPAGTNIIGKVGIDQTTPGTTNGVQVNAALPAGTNVLGKVSIDQTTPGTTNLVALAANQSVNNAQIVGNTISTGSGVMGTGTQRMALATDSPGIVTLGQTTKSASVPVTVASDQGSLGALSSQYPSGATPITASATGTTAATTATLAAAVSKTTYICGFAMRSVATAAAAGNATVTGTITGTLNFTHGTGATPTVIPNDQRFNPCIPGSTTNTAIAVVSPAAGTGGVMSVTAWGYQL